jgi:large subunit ribosomal protein L9
MKVILNQDIPGVGKKWDVKELKAGYIRNYLLPGNLAVLATPKAVKEAELKKEQEAQKRAIQEDLLEKSLDLLKDFTLVIEKKTNEKGHLYDSIDVKEIAELLTEKFPPKADQPLAEKSEILPEYVKIEKPIKETGKYKIAVAKGNRQVSFEIEVVPIPR